MLKAMQRYGKKSRTYNTRFMAMAAGREQPFRTHEGTAVYIRKGDYVILEVHYLGNGKEDFEQTKVEFFGYREKGKLKRMIGTIFQENDYVIPPHTKKHVLHYRPRRVSKSIDIIGMLTHMHVRGRSIKFSVLFPNGKEETIISVPNFDYSWHTGAQLDPVKPIRIPEGSTLKLRCEFDNSSLNPMNPDPSKTIRFGQLFDRTEMCKLNYWFVFVDESQSEKGGGLSEPISPSPRNQ